ncbi:MAG: hypothetical protein NVSMB52_04020 [Chloroflexota bacterium]
MAFLFSLMCSLAIADRTHTVVADVNAPTAIVSSPEPTFPVATAVPEPTQMPTLIQEQALPSPTAQIPATPTPVQELAPTAVPTVAMTPTPLEQRVIALPSVSALPTSDTSVWPSPAQLKQGARLRWGKRVPRAVRRWAFLIVPAARKYHLDPNLLAAVMTMESGGDPLALSGADARGLMQILHGPWDPATNVDTGARMLSNLYSEFGDWSLALAAYNAGEGAVIAYGAVPPYRETRDYVIVVRYLWDLFGHHKLTRVRKRQYRATLTDLQHFSDQRKKVSKLAKIAHVPTVPVTPCSHKDCFDSQPSKKPTVALDPFWPIPGVPDPLQRVDPRAATP